MKLGKNQKSVIKYMQTYTEKYPTVYLSNIVISIWGYDVITKSSAVNLMESLAVKGLVEKESKDGMFWHLTEKGKND